MRRSQILAASVIVSSLLVGASSDGLANKPRGSTALPKTRNACNNPQVSTCRWDVRIVAESHTQTGDGDYSRAMDAHWIVTYKNVSLRLPTAAQQALGENEPDGDFIRMSGGGKSVTVGTVGFKQSGQGVPNCSWQKSYRVPTLLAIDSRLKLLVPLGNGIGSGVEPWHFAVTSYFNREVATTGDYCQPGNTEATQLGMPQPQCCRLGGPSIREVSFEPFFTTKLLVYYLRTLKRLPFPWTEFWAGRNVTVSKKWHVSPVTGTVMSGGVTITFTRRR